MYVSVLVTKRKKKRKSIHLPDLITLSWTNNRSSKLHMEEFVFEIRPIQGMIVGFQRGARVFLVNMPLQTGRVALARKREQNTRPYSVRVAFEVAKGAFHLGERQLGDRSVVRSMSDHPSFIESNKPMVRQTLSPTTNF